MTSQSGNKNVTKRRVHIGVICNPDDISSNSRNSNDLREYELLCLPREMTKVPREFEARSMKNKKEKITSTEKLEKCIILTSSFQKVIRLISRSVVQTSHV